MIDKLKEELYFILHLTRLVRDEPMPDWWNQHDFSSGYFSGRKEAARLSSSYIESIIEKLDELNGNQAESVVLPSDD
jgi:hypothetical protein